MRWSAKLGRFAGIDVYIHASFLLLLAWVAYTAWIDTGTLRGVLDGLTLIVVLFACVLLHEFGHALTARRFGVATRYITLLPIGGLALLESMPRDPWQEIVVALAGPAVNLVIAALAWVAMRLAGESGVLFSLPFGQGLLPTLLAANLMLAVFNLLPAFPMDGGRVLRAALSLRMDRLRATRTAALIGQGLAVGLGILGLVDKNPFLVLIAVFVWIGAGAEAGAVAADVGLGRQSAGTAMTTDFRTLPADAPLTAAIDLSAAGGQQDFPVLEGGRLVGVLTHAAMLHGLRDLGPQAPVSQAMQPAATADVATPLAALLNDRPPGLRTVCITRNGVLAGVLDLEAVAGRLRLKTASGR